MPNTVVRGVSFAMVRLILVHGTVYVQSRQTFWGNYSLLLICARRLWRSEYNGLLLPGFKN